jgi:hypothetical protein
MMCDMGMKSRIVFDLDFASPWVRSSVGINSQTIAFGLFGTRGLFRGPFGLIVTSEGY